MTKKIIAIINAGLDGYPSRMLRYMQNYVETESPDYYTIEFQKILSTTDDHNFLIAEFNRKYKELHVAIGTYHATAQLDSDEVCKDIYHTDYYSAREFISACELEVESKRQELVEHFKDFEEEK